MENNTIIKKPQQGKGIHKKKNYFSINISKGGGIGIGVGIILVGGALLVNAFQKKPPKKPINKKNHHHSSTAENLKTSADNTYDQHLICSDGTEKATGSGVSREISAQKLLQDDNHKFEGSNGKEDHLKCDDDDDQETTSCSKDSENPTLECNGSVVDQLSSSAITDSLLHQPIVSNIDNQEIGEEEADVKMVSCIEVNSGLIDRDDQESGSIADTEIHGQDDDLIALESFEDSKVNEIQEAADEDDSEINNAEIFVSENEEKGSLNIKIVKEEEINGTFEADQGDKVKITTAIQTCEGIGTKGESQPQTPCPNEEKTAQYDGLIDDVEAQHEVQIDGARGEIDDQDSNNGLLITSDVGVLDKTELVEEPKIEEEPATPKLEEKEAESDAQTNAETEAIEEKISQNSALFNAPEINSSIVHTSKLIECQVIEEAIEEKEEKEAQHDVHINAAGEIQTIPDQDHVQTNGETESIEEKRPQNSALFNAAGEAFEEEETQHDVPTNAVGEAAEFDSSIEHTSKLIECQVIEEAIEDKEEKEVQHDVHINAAGEIQTILDQDHTQISHQITSDNILPQENDQNISSSELSILPELNPATGLKIDSKDVGIDLHSIEPVTEKDIIYQETAELSQEHLMTPIVGENNEGGSRAVIFDNVEESSEGSLVHEVPMQVKDQTGKLQDNEEHVTLQKSEKEIHYKEIEDDAIISSENIQTVNMEKGIPNMNFFKKYMVKLTEQKNDEKTSLLMRKRGPIVIGTMSALLWPVCYSYFGLPFLKIFLIAVLVMVLSKIHGF